MMGMRVFKYLHLTSFNGKEKGKLQKKNVITNFRYLQENTMGFSCQTTSF